MGNRTAHGRTGRPWDNRTARGRGHGTGRPAGDGWNRTARGRTGRLMGQQDGPRENRTARGEQDGPWDNRTARGKQDGPWDNRTARGRTGRPMGQQDGPRENRMARDNRTAPENRRHEGDVAGRSEADLKRHTRPRMSSQSSFHFSLSSRQAASELSREKATKMFKNWEDYTPEDDESLYTEEFDLLKVLGLQEPQEDQDQQDLALVSSPPPVTSDASEAQTRDENLLKELMELRTIRNREREEFSRVILAHQTKEKDLLKELDQVKEESSRLTHLSVHQHQDEKVKLLRQMKQIIVAHRNELEKQP
ncbi:hypothetical protein WMY93_022658 [Mugilogobius chulae]|uniref:Uncharacterized protein n=1 Tax=Mugilogobius chulae TaxID=88201 RepID=A0AAW0N7K6_9GOBI